MLMETTVAGFSCQEASQRAAEGELELMGWTRSGRIGVSKRPVGEEPGRRRPAAAFPSSYISVGDLNNIEWPF